MKILEYAKAHPVATGFILVVGGFIFILIVRGGGSTQEASAPSGPSDAQIAANATLQAAQIQANAGISAASIGAGVQLNSDNKAAEVAMAQINAAKELGLADLGAQERAITTQITVEGQKYNAALQALPSLKKKSRGNAFQALVTGQPVQRQSNYGNSAAGIIGSAGGLVQGIASIFSDQRLKENIRYVGNDMTGRRVYDFNYKGSTKTRRGYIAQDFVRDEPHNVIVDSNSGYLKISAASL